MPRHAGVISQARAERLAVIRRLHGQGRSSTQIGKELGIAPSTVRDYLTDPYRRKARHRQLARAVSPAVNLNGGQVTRLDFPGVHKGKGEAHNQARNRQARAIIGSYARR